MSTFLARYHPLRKSTSQKNVFVQESTLEILQIRLWLLMCCGRSELENLLTDIANCCGRMKRSPLGSFPHTTLQNLKLAQSCVFFFVRYSSIIAMLQYNLRPVGAVCLLLFCLVIAGVHALDSGEVVALQDMQLEWGQKLDRSA
jgi:hypothetical protein